MTLRLLLAAAAALAFGSAALAAADEPHHLSAAQLKALVVTLKEGVISAPVPTGPGATMLVVRRDRDGEAEVHDHLNDEIVAQGGHAIIRVGGTVTGNRQTAPGEWRGGTIEGGSFYNMSAGDVLWIPAGRPHQTLVAKGSSFNYLAFKFEAKP